jgi:hypothetical protein
MKNVVKFMNKHSKGPGYLRETFPKLSDAKLQDGIFIGQHIHEIIIDELFERPLTETEKSA